MLAWSNTFPSCSQLMVEDIAGDCWAGADLSDLVQFLITPRRPSFISCHFLLPAVRGSSWNNGKEVPRWGVAEIQKMSPSTTGRCKQTRELGQPTNRSLAQRHSSQSNGFAVRVWSTMCICCPGVVELVRSNLDPPSHYSITCVLAGCWMLLWRWWLCFV